MNCPFDLIIILRNDTVNRIETRNAQTSCYFYHSGIVFPPGVKLKIPGQSCKGRIRQRQWWRTRKAIFREEVLLELLSFGFSAFSPVQEQFCNISLKKISSFVGPNITDRVEICVAKKRIAE